MSRLHSRSWAGRDTARTSRIGMAAEDAIDRWFDGRTTPPDA